MSTLINELEAKRSVYVQAAESKTLTFDAHVESFDKAEAYGEAIKIVKKFVADNADLLDGNPAVLIEKLTGDI